ncbi:MAG: hypothetical protein RLY43_993 [Bacteroidota bacterium]|jgi:hypothetical protein
MDYESRRIDDERFNQIMKILDKLDKELWGNGRIGLFKEHVICQEKIKSFDSISAWMKGNIIALVLAIITAAFGYGQLYNKVNTFEKAVKVIIEQEAFK